MTQLVVQTVPTIHIDHQESRVFSKLLTHISRWKTVHLKIDVRSTLWSPKQVGCDWDTVSIVAIKTVKVMQALLIEQHAYFHRHVLLDNLFWITRIIPYVRMSQRLFPTLMVFDRVINCNKNSSMHDVYDGITSHLCASVSSSNENHLVTSFAHMTMRFLIETMICKSFY